MNGARSVGRPGALGLMVIWMAAQGFTWGQCPALNGTPISCSGGNVGVGMTGATSLLDVNGQVTIEQKDFGGNAGLLIKGLNQAFNWPTIGFSTQNNSGIDVVGMILEGQIRSSTPNQETMDFLLHTMDSGVLHERLRVLSNGKVGIGTPNPTATLDILANSTTLTPQLRLRPLGVANSTSSIPSYLDFFASFDNYPYDSAPRRTAAIKARYSGGVWGSETLIFEVGGSNDAQAEPVERMRITGNGNVGIGTSSAPYRLTVEGAVGAREVIVTTSLWSDYVFRPGYRLKPLSEVGAYIQENHHLPDMPSEAEVKEKGVNMGEMQAKLLAKIEELTLHMIRQENELHDLRSKLAGLAKPGK